MPRILILGPAVMPKTDIRVQGNIATDNFTLGVPWILHPEYRPYVFL